MRTDRLKHNSLYNAIIALIIVICIAIFAIPAFADGCKPTKCPTTCSANSAANCRKMDANCVVNQNKNIEGGSCFNNVPITSTSSVASQCSSGDAKARGTNFAVANFSKDNPAYVKAAADGIVRYTGPSKDGGGRMVVIEHTKACGDSSHGDSGNYITTYRHLLSINVGPGAIVKANDIIGIAGGSTSTEAGAICDNKAQANMKGYDNSGCSGTKAEDINLNFEVNDGPYTQSNAASDSGLNSNCNEIQNFCGSCSSSDLATCISENPAEYREVTTASITTDGSTGSSNSSASASCKDGLFISGENCIFCGLFKDLFNAASDIAKIANEGLAIPTRNLVGIGFLIWLAIFVLRNITSFGAVGIPDLLKTILFQGFRVTVVMLILGGAIYQVMDLTINPVMQTGLAFARTVSGGEQSTCSADAEYLQGIVGYDENKGFQKTSEGGLSKQLGISYVCSVKKIEDGVTKLMRFGNYSICLSFKDFPSLGFIPHAGFLTTGMFLYVVGALLLIMFPWFLIDCLLHLCIVVALLPCAIGAFAFKITAKYLKILWSYFMNSMFMFVFVSIVIFIVTANFKTWLGYDFDANEIDPNRFINAGGNGLAWWGIGAFRILGMAIFCFIFLDEARNMADKFASAPKLGGGKGIGTMFGGLAASSGVSLGKAGLQVGGKVGEDIGEGLSSLMGAKTESMSNHAKGILMKATGGEKITDDKGNTIGYRKTGRFFGKEYTNEYLKDDKGVWSSHSQWGTTETIDDTILNTKLTKNSNGNIVGIDTQAKTVSSKYLINEGGTVNTNAVDQLLANSGNKEYAARHVVGEVMKSRGMQLDDRFISSEIKINGNNYDSFTIIQKNEDGKLQTINANLDKETGIMTIKSDIDDGSGNITSTISDGIHKNRQTTSKRAASSTGSGFTANSSGITAEAVAVADSEGASNKTKAAATAAAVSASSSDSESSQASSSKNIKPQQKDRLTDLLHSGKISEDEMNEIIDRLDSGMTDGEFEQLIAEFSSAAKK